MPVSRGFYFKLISLPRGGWHGGKGLIIIEGIFFLKKDLVSKISDLNLQISFTEGVTKLKSFALWS